MVSYNLKPVRKFFQRRLIIEIGGDSNGGSVKITDQNGKTRVDIHGKGNTRPESSTSH